MDGLTEAEGIQANIKMIREYTNIVDLIVLGMYGPSL